MQTLGRVVQQIDDEDERERDDGRKKNENQSGMIFEMVITR